MNEKPKSKPSCYVTKIDTDLKDKLKSDLTSQGFTFSQPPYTFFSAKKKGLSVSFYESGKIMVQGKDMQEFIEFYLEPELLKSFQFSNPLAYTDQTPRIGVDEAGKGDFFGSLCIAGVYASAHSFQPLVDLRLRDSKTMTDKAVLEMSKEIKKLLTHHIIIISPQKYNELYAKFFNLNKLLAWGHSTVIKELNQKTQCKDVLIDQFAHESLVQSALDRMQVNVNLKQRHRAEEDVVVAAAACLARAAFLNNLKKLSEEIEMTLPKGASSLTIEAGKKIVQKFGPDVLKKFSKAHFKTFDDVMKLC